MRTLAFVAAFALIGSAAGAQTMTTTEKTTTTAPAPMATTTTVRTHTHTSTMAMHSNHHMMRHCMTKMRNGHKVRTCKKTMMHKKMADMPNM